MDDLVIADADENDYSRKIRITISTAFKDPQRALVRCLVNKLKYGVTYSDKIEEQLVELEEQFSESSWKALQRNFTKFASKVEQEIGVVDETINELVDTNPVRTPEEVTPLKSSPSEKSDSPREETEA